MFIKLYVIALVVFLAIDAVWLTLVAPKFYKTHLGHLMAETPNLIVALVFYLIFIVGVVYFVLIPGIDQNISKVIIAGLLFGLVTYATYDLTNMATLKEWPPIVTVVDLIWGSSLTTMVGVISYYIYNAIW